MIVSHKHKFIFIHLGRTGGRSLTRALAKHCGPDDLVTPSGGVGQNAHMRERHLTALQIRDKVGRAVFEDYFKFTIERNPWDKTISRYWDYAGRTDQTFYKEIPRYLTGSPLSFTTWFNLRVIQGRVLGFGHYRFPRHFGCYTEDDVPIVDFIGRYEHLTDHLAILSDRLKIDIRLKSTSGSQFHKERKPYTDVFDARMRGIIESCFRKDLEFLSYRFGEPAPADAIEPKRRG